MRAADSGWAAHFLAFFVALSFLRFDGEPTPSPTALTLAVGQPVLHNMVSFFEIQIRVL